VGNRWKLVDVEHWDCYRDDAVVNTPITKASCLYFEIGALRRLYTEVCRFLSHYKKEVHMSVAGRLPDIIIVVAITERFAFSSDL
jgi:hypothetical protein